MNKQFYTSKKIFTGRHWLEGQVLVTENGRIHDILPSGETGDAPVEDLGDQILAPAFIDIQIYGAGKKLFSVFPEPASLKILADHNLSGGTSLCLPTMATNDLSVFRAGIDAIRKYWQNGGMGIHGIHLEGPWINPVRKGAHIGSYIHSPAMEEVKELVEYGKGVIKMITLAPECCPEEVIGYLVDQDIRVSAGHSNARYEEMIKAARRGVRLVTHLYNAMSPLHHRDPGLVGAAMDDAQLMASIIPDGIHVDWTALRIAKKAMGPRLFAITDAVTDTDRGDYQHIFAGEKYEAGGILSGSALTMGKALSNLHQQAGIELEEAIRMCSLYPARALGLENERGLLAPGYRADMVALDKSGEFIKLIN